MKIKHQFNLNIALFIVPGFLLLLSLLSGFILASSITHASNTEDSNVAVIVNSACTITTGGGSYAKTISPGTTDTIQGNGINVTCNDSNGYSLYAVGFTNNSYDTPNNTRLISANDANYIPTGTSGDSYWSMKATGSSDISTAPTIDNGYSTFKNIPATFTKISHYTGATIGTTTNSVTTPTYQVHVSTSQPASTYIGKVKYTLVHPHNVDTGANTNMQNWAGCSGLAIGSETFLRDTRDSKYYRIVKYNDGKCWMVDNLDLAGGTTLSYTDTDFESGYTLPTANGFQSGNKLPESEIPVSGATLPSTAFSDNSTAYVYNSNSATCASGSPCYSYYSWTTATLGSGLSISADNTDATYSICPKGWHLPNTRTGTNDTADFRKLMIILGGSASIAVYDSTTSPTGATIFNGLTGTPLYFLRSGYYNSGSFSAGGSGCYYWLATSYSSTRARYSFFNSSLVDSASSYNRQGGFSVRCVTGG